MAWTIPSKLNTWFLMHRVELKVEREINVPKLKQVVPNAPCGVERAIVLPCTASKNLRFLMHRVELKELQTIFRCYFFSIVPNAPCGVEREDLGGKLFYSLPHVPNAPCGVERYGVCG